MRYCLYCSFQYSIEINDVLSKYYRGTHVVRLPMHDFQYSIEITIALERKVNTEDIGGPFNILLKSPLISRNKPALRLILPLSIFYWNHLLLWLFRWLWLASTHLSIFYWNHQLIGRLPPGQELSLSIFYWNHLWFYSCLCYIYCFIIITFNILLKSPD